MKVCITEDCISCGVCVDICPDVFELGNMMAVVKVDAIPAQLEEAVKDCIESCPVEAIKEE